MISLFRGLSYDNFSQNLLAIGVIGRVMNSIVKNMITGHSHGADFVFGMIASIVGVQIMKESHELKVEDDISHPEIL